MIIALVVAMSIASPYFLTAANFKAMIVGLVPTAIIVVGMTILLVSGSFDLSVGSTLALSSTVVAILLLVGLTNGLIVTLLRVNPLIATLGTMSVGRRVALVFTDGFSLTNLPAGFAAFGKTEFLGLPLMAWIMVVIIAVGDFALRRTRFLRQVILLAAMKRRPSFGHCRRSGAGDHLCHFRRVGSRCRGHARLAAHRSKSRAALRRSSRNLSASI